MESRHNHSETVQLRTDLCRMLIAVALVTLFAAITTPFWLLNRPHSIVIGRRHVWLGPQYVLKYQFVALGNGWMRMVLPEAPNGTYGPEDLSGAVRSGGAPTLEAPPWTSLCYYHLGPVRFVVLQW
jgi:hypothetical protein